MHITKAKIFLSYAREDVLKVENIYKKLSEAGFSPWMDTRNLTPGEEWRVSIENAIRDSHFFIIFLSTNTLKRGMIQKEIRIAFEIWSEMFDNDIYFIPVRLEECKIPEKLSKFQYLDLFVDSENRFLKLVEIIQEGLNRRDMLDKDLQPGSIGKLLSNISYDFGTLIALIEGETQWLLHLNEEVKLTEKEIISSLKNINSFSERAKRLTDWLAKESKQFI